LIASAKGVPPPAPNASSHGFNAVATGNEQSQPGALPIGVIKHTRQQAFGQTQRLMAPGRCRSVHDHQPELFRSPTAGLVDQIGAHAWAPPQ
jgi:hypothetical protein